MKKFFPLFFIFCLVFASISYAGENDATFQDLQIELGTMQAGYINKKFLSEIPENEAYKTQIWYPSKLDTFQKYEWVEVMKLKHDTWEIKNPDTGGAVEFSVSYENNKIKISNISSTPPTKEPQIQQQVVSSSELRERYYVAFKGGIYSPTDDYEGNDFDDGFSGEVAITTYFNKNLAFEAGIGYFDSEANGPVSAFGYSVNADAEAYSIPVTATVKGILPFKYVELFLGAGIAGYYVHGKVDYHIPGLISGSLSDDDYILGAHFLGGANFNITETFFLGFEGKYIFTQDAELKSNDWRIPGKIEFNLNGFIASGVLGFRF